MTSDQAAERRIVWEALSCLFLDTDTRLLETYVVRQLSGTRFGVSELEHILIHEIRPVLFWNRYAVAGVWDAFDQRWLEETIRRQSRSPVRYLHRVWAPVVSAQLRRDEQWHRIVAGIHESRSRGAGQPGELGSSI